MQRKIERFLTRDLPAPEQPGVLGGTDLSQFAGDYYPTSARFGLQAWQAGNAPRAKVRVAGAELLFTRRGRQTRLLPVSLNGHFRRPEDPVATVIFARGGSGSLYLQGQLGNYVNLLLAPCPGFIGACVTQSPINPDRQAHGVSGP